MSNKEKERWMKYSYVISSKVRKKIILALGKKPLTPTQIAEKTEMNLSQVSHSLTDLSDEGMIECMNPEQKKGRLYTLLEDGEWVLKKIDE